jgi:superfamily II DNA or RNA helicase
MTAVAAAGPPALRPYQLECVEQVRAAYRAGRRRVLLQSPTGSGKTVIFTHILMARQDRGGRTAILLHRRELVDQVARVLTILGVAHDVVAAGYPEPPAAMPVRVASVQTLVRRLDHVAGIDLLVIDEAHHSVAATWRTIFSACTQAHVLGLTATPERADGRGLDDLYDDLVLGPSVRMLEDAGWLTPALVYAAPAPDLSRVRKLAGDYSAAALDRLMGDGGLVGDAVAHWQRHAAGLPTITFCCSIAHSRAVAARFCAAGVNARHIDGDTPDDERHAAISGLADGTTQVLTNCGLISEGVDVPAAAALVVLRPTLSLALHLQMLGRVGRPYPGKARSIVLDHAGNTLRLGLPNTEHRWSLHGRPKEARQWGAPVKRCPYCSVVIPAGCRQCPHCGAELVTGEPPEERPGRLVPIMHEQQLRARLRAYRYGEALRWAGDDPARLHQVALARGYKRGWEWHRLTELRDRRAEPSR